MGTIPDLCSPESIKKIRLINSKTIIYCIKKALRAKHITKTNVPTL